MGRIKIPDPFTINDIYIDIDKYKNFGNYLVLVIDCNKFINQMKNVCNKHSIRLQADCVDYYDSKKQHISKRGRESFYKLHEFRWQQEWRAEFTHNNQENIINIGDISNITMIIKTKDFNNSIALTPK